MKQLIRHRGKLSILIAVLMVLAMSCRVYLTHDRGYYEIFHSTEEASMVNGAWYSCNCPVCHEEDFLAIAAEFCDYHPFVVTMDFTYAVQPTAEANRIVVTSSLRGPPYLS